MLNRTRFGLHTIATGGNLVAAAEVGIKVTSIKISNFVLCSMLGGFAGIIDAFRIGSIDPLAGGSEIMFTAIASAVIGGTLLTGGSGTVIGALIGALALGILKDGFTLSGRERLHFRHDPRRRHPGDDGGQRPADDVARTGRRMMAASIGPEVLRAEHVEKSFGRIVALKDVNLRLRRGEVLGLLGDNGAGKSTLMKIFTGFYQPSAGQLYFDGRPVQFRSVSHARSLGIEAVYQDLALVNELNVYRNMFLQREPVFGGPPGNSRRAPDAPPGDRDARAYAGQDPLRRCRRRQALGRTAPGRRHRALRLPEGEGAPARRADRGDGREGVGADPRPHPAAEGERAKSR